MHQKNIFFKTQKVKDFVWFHPKPQPTLHVPNAQLFPFSQWHPHFPPGTRVHLHWPLVQWQNHPLKTQTGRNSIDIVSFGQTVLHFPDQGRVPTKRVGRIGPERNRESHPRERKTVPFDCPTDSNEGRAGPIQGKPAESVLFPEGTRRTRPKDAQRVRFHGQSRTGSHPPNHWGRIGPHRQKRVFKWTLRLQGFRVLRVPGQTGEVQKGTVSSVRHKSWFLEVTSLQRTGPFKGERTHFKVRKVCKKDRTKSKKHGKQV